VPAGQAAARPNPELEDDLADGAEQAPHILRQDAQAALARLQLSQLASLPKADAAAHWTFELPIDTADGVAVAQFEISRDGHGQGGGEAAPPAWRARFSLDIEPGGPVHADISLSGGRTRVTLWAERDSARQTLEAERGDLQAALAGPEGADAAVRVLAGAPAPAPVSPAGHFLDRTS
ncbi:MAG TPA: flagellar hook-length control protein FliK, partial [Caulobacteraceae bacterium]